MATSKKAASKKAAGKKSADKKPAVTKKPKARMAKEKPTAQPSLDRTVNLGPLRGDNSFPPSNKPVGIPGSQGKRGAA